LAWRSGRGHLCGGIQFTPTQASALTVAVLAATPRHRRGINTERWQRFPVILSGKGAKPFRQEALSGPVALIGITLPSAEPPLDPLRPAAP